MLNLALSTSQFADYMQTLRTSHVVKITARILNRNEQVISQLDVPSSQMIDGAVTYDATASVTRSLAMTFLDPSRRLGFDAGSPARGALFADNMISIRYGVLVPAIGWVEVPVFWGPVTNFERDQGVVTVEAQGKEALALDPHFVTQGYTIKKGRRVDNAIRDVMDRVGETRYALPDLPARLPRRRAVEPEDEPWDIVKFGWEADTRVWKGKGKDRHRERVTVEYNGIVSLAGPMHIFYDGNGRLTVRRRSKTEVIVLKGGRDLMSEPVVSWDALAARNHVVVTGAKVTVGKQHIQRRGSATLQSGHPLAPLTIGRNGHPRYMTEFVEVDSLKTHQACVDRARRVLEEKADDGIDLQFDCLPMPHLEELDVIHVQTDSYALSLPLRTWTLPLTVGSGDSPNPMQIGASL